MRKGFTLIELMIVVAIIAVIAAIAIPNLLASRMAANETSAIACMRTYLGGQTQFHRTDFYGNNFLVYAHKEADSSIAIGGAGFPDLYAVSGQSLKLIDKLFAGAVWVSDPAAGKPRAGYCFDDIPYADPSIDCGLWAAPNVFERGGRNEFVIDITGVVYMKMLTTRGVAKTEYGDASTWIPVGSE